MVKGCEKILSILTQKKKLNESKESEIRENMDKILCNDTEVNKDEEDADPLPKDYAEVEKSDNVVLRRPSNSSCWWSPENEGEKLDSRQRWSFGSDISIEAPESVQNRLCCSPVDEFDSTVSSENEDLIVNNTEDKDDPYKNYVQVSPASSPIFDKVMHSIDNKTGEENQDVDTADDELIDYSKRYTTDSSISMLENKHINSLRIRQQRNILVVNTVPRHVPEKKPTSVNNRSKVDLYGDYAETDLDQPTDYSLRYAEEDTDEEDKENPRLYCNGEQEDSVKTYYTEGTPYQTPCNVSNSTSMSDLLTLDDIKEGEAAVYKRQILKEQKQEKVVKYCKNRIRKKCISEDSKFPVLQETSETNNQKPCEETPVKSHTPPRTSPVPSNKEKENKLVTFNVEEMYAQETPLMFSRSSSLDSLSEFDQHSIQDDHSSVISDFSHRTSGVVSPSELPDSPTQTVPPSPNRAKQQNYQLKSQQAQRMPIRPAVRRPPVELQDDNNSKVSLIKSLPGRSKQTFENSNRAIEASSVFEDGVVSFKEESMPSRVHSTRASSLSALTIDDEGDDESISGCNNHEILNKIASIKMRTNGIHTEQSPPPAQKQYNNEPLNYRDNKSPCHSQHNNSLNRHQGYRNNFLIMSPTKNKEENCFINIIEDNNDYTCNFVHKEMQNNRYRESLKDPWYEEHKKKESRHHPDRSLSRSPIFRCSNHNVSSQKIDDETVPMDTIRTYCTEDTPTFISPFGSQSNLSALSALSISDENISYNPNYQEEQARSYYEEEGSSSRVDAYDTDTSTDFPEDEEKVYDDEEDELLNSRRRIDVSPFDSQLNLANFSLLCIEEEEEEDREEEEEASNETDKSARDDSYSEDVDFYKMRNPRIL